MAEKSDYNLVQNLAALRIAKLAQSGMLGFERQFWDADERGGDLERLAARQAHCPQATSSGGRANGHDGVVVGHNIG